MHKTGDWFIGFHCRHLDHTLFWIAFFFKMKLCSTFHFSILFERNAQKGGNGAELEHVDLCPGNLTATGGLKRFACWDLHVLHK